jgi:predicted NBD/HSP70 family sugar kinase
MQKNPFLNQNNIRFQNQLKVFSLLKEGDYSCSDLAKKLNLSNTALANIIEDLVSCNIAKISTNIKSKIMGRKPIMYELNPDFGLFVVIDMIKRDIEIQVCDLKRNILKKIVLPEILYIDEQTINLIIKTLKNILNSEECKGKPLQVICIGTPGKIDQNSGCFLFAPRFIDYKEVSLKKIFEENFDTLILIKNDVKLALSGECTFGLTKEIQNAIFLYIDYNHGGALLLNGNILEGEHGFAGEFGEMREIGNKNFRYTSHSISISGMIIEIKHRLLDCNVSHMLSNQDDFSVHELTKLYNDNDTMVCDVVNNAAICTGILINNLISILDISNVIIYGRIRYFGERYLNVINETIKTYSDNTIDMKINFSKLENQATIIGGISNAIDTCINKTLQCK